MNERVPFSYLLAIAWTMMSGIALRMFLGGLVELRPNAAYDIVSLGAIEAIVFLGGVLAVLTIHGRPDVPLRTALGIRPTHPALSALGLCLGIATHWSAETLDSLFQRFVPTPEEEIAARMALLSAPSPLRFALVLFVVACAGPFVEELFFRGAIYGSLRRTRPFLGAVLVTSFCFVVGHLDVRMWPALTVVALVMSYLRAASGSLLPSLAMHVSFNAATVLAVATGQVPPPGPPKIEPIAAALGWGSTLGLVFAVRYVALRAREARRGRAEDAE